jgi:hypothetical protein
MRIEVLPLDFIGTGAMLEPADPKLHDLAVNYAQRELKDGDKLNLTKFAKSWVGLKDGVPFGLMGYVLKADVPLFRATDVDVLRVMGERLNNFFSDNGARGREVLLYLGDEPEAQRCPKWRDAIKEFGGKSGRRILFEVR